MPQDTIAAIATAPGQGGVGIVRVSGPLVPALIETVLGKPAKPRFAYYANFNNSEGELIDQGLLISFPAPHSFTGEHVVELQGHGGPVVMRLLLARVCELGARQAKPGEFSERAFINDKLDLAQAEAIADLISSGSEQAARAAMQSLQGVFSRRVHYLVELLTQLRMYVEAAIDFPDEEDVDFLGDGEVLRQLSEIQFYFETTQDAAEQGRLMQEGMTVVLAGRPNVGKSSLLNALTGEDTAIVTSIAGTTRDVLREQINLDGMPLHIVDTAGLRVATDAVEAEGIRRAHKAIEQADRVLLLVDTEQGFGDSEIELLASLPANLPVTVVINKTDLAVAPVLKHPRVSAQQAISVKQGHGIAELRQHLQDSMGFEAAAGSFSARQRHLDALDEAWQHVQSASEQLMAGAGELVAEELRLAQNQLGEITGKVTADELLGKIFSTFCIGK